MKPLKIKKPSKFKEKIKSFFNFDIEKDLKEEEEGTKQFEKVPVFTLTRTNLFLAILLFTIIVNVLVGFDINYFYIRAILGFLFLVIIPGLLIMLCFKIRTIGFWEYLVYTVGLSISFIMFAGLIVNWTLPWLGITDKPLSLWPILICFDIFLIALGITAWIRNKDLKPFQVTVPKLDLLNNIFFIIPMTFPILAILGAFLLNNHGSNILTMIMLGGIAVYVLLLTIFRKKMNENIWPWALYWIGLALLFSGWMRGWFINGMDNSLEYHIFYLTNSLKVWDLTNYYHTYNAMLSINILPTSFGIFIGNISQFLFKFYFQILSSILAIISYIYIRNIFNSIIAFLSTIFFLSLPMLYAGSSIAIRQEIAFIFFGLMFLTLFHKNLISSNKKFLFLILGISMIVSHYSTAYITVALTILTYLFFLIYNVYNNYSLNKKKDIKSGKIVFPLTGILIFSLLVFGFLWYSQITPTGDNLIGFARQSLSNLNNIFDEENRLGNQGIIENLFTVSSNTNPLAILSDYTEISLQESQKEKNYPSAINFSPILTNSYESNLNYSPFPSSIKFYIELISRILLIIGFLIFLLSNYFSKERSDSIVQFKLFGASFMVLSFCLIILPFFSISYDRARFYQQVILITSPFLFFGVSFIFSFFSKKNKIILSAIFLILYLIIIYGVIFSFFNSPDVTLRLDNYGREYRIYYNDKTILSPFDWIKEYTQKINLNVDRVYSYKFNVLREDNSISLNRAVFPYNINKENYVFLGYNNKVLGFGTSVYKGYWFSFIFPTDFINTNKNKIYNNGNSEIFK